jgi:hypothetical protein
VAAAQGSFPPGEPGPAVDRREVKA